MTLTEWESLCDKCGRCCLQKIGDGDSGKIKLLAISCEYLDASTCHCLIYENRKRLKPDCVKISPEKLSQVMGWLPAISCKRRGLRRCTLNCGFAAEQLCDPLHIDKTDPVIVFGR